MWRLTPRFQGDYVRPCPSVTRSSAGEPVREGIECMLDGDIATAKTVLP